MTQNRMTRRQALATSAAVAPLLAATSATRAAESKASSLSVGMATTGFHQFSNRQMAEEMARQGVRTVQLFLTQTDSNYWKYNQRNDLSDLTAARCKAIAETYRSAGLTIHSLGVYTNLIHPDPAERAANMAYFEAMMVVGEHMGVRTFISEAGHYQPKESTGNVEYHFREDVWKAMVTTGKELAALAERHDAVVLMEPFFGGFLASAKRTRLFLEEVGSRRIRALLDPANLLEINDLDEMFEQLQPYIDCLHAKDRKLHVGRGVPAGQGDLDYRKFLTLAATRTPQAPLVLEYVGAQDYGQALAHLRNMMRDVGLRER